MNSCKNKNLRRDYLIWKEIESQGKIIKFIISKFLKIESELLNIFKKYEDIYFIGCGSSYHVGLIASFTYNKLLNKNSTCIPSSEFITYPEIFFQNNSKYDKFILISRTGKTTETLIVADIIKKKMGQSISLTTFNSELAKKCEYSIVIEEAQEKSITATRSVISSTIVLLSLIFMLSKKGKFIKKISVNSDKFFENFNKYSNIISSIINSEDFNKFIFLGAGSFFGVAKEAGLKVKEMSITNSEACQPLEYRHGHKSIIDTSCMITFFLSEAGFDHEIRTAKEFKKLGGKVLIICDNIKKSKLQGSYDFIIDVNLNLEELIKPIFYQIFGQLIGYHQALKKGIDPSNPKNLDYCVTF